MAMPTPLGIAPTIAREHVDATLASEPPRRAAEPTAASASVSTAAGERVRASAGVRPERVGRYVIREQLGAGGMGVVYAGHDPELDRRLAIKFLHPGHAGAEAEVRLLREAQAMARLSHPNVVQIHDVGVVDDQVFVAMELIAGRTARVWADEAPRTWREVLAVYLDAGRGLAAAHDAGLVHRDFKPDNVLIADDGRVRVADFGLARGLGGTAATSPDAAFAGVLDQTVTRTGAVLGTPAYMSPEQHAGGEADARSDQFSLCVAVYEALYSQRPYAGDSYLEVSVSVLGGALREPPVGAAAPRWISAVLRRGLAVDPAARFPDMRALLAELGRDPDRARRRWVLASAALLVAGVSAGIAAAHAGPAVCVEGSTALAGVWDDGRREAVAAAFAAVDHPLAAASHAHARVALDEYAGAWSAMRTEACETHRGGDQSDTLFDRRNTCLDRRKQALTTAVEVLLGVDASKLDAAAQAVASLPPLATCGDVAAITATVAAPEDPAIAAAVEVQRQRLAGVRTLSAADDPRVDAELAAITAAAEPLAHRPLLAEVALASGIVAMDRQAHVAATAPLAAAVAHALASAHDGVAVEALARQVFVDGAVLGDFEGAALRADIAWPLSERLAERDLHGARLANNFGLAHITRRDRVGATAWLQRAVDAAGRATGVDPIEASNYRMNLATVTADDAVREAAIDASLAGIAAALPSHHLQVLTRQRAAAEYVTDPSRRRALLTTACAGHERRAAVSDECGECLVDLGHALAEADERGQAAAAVERAAACVPSPDSIDPAEAARRGFGAATRRGIAALWRGRSDEAIAALREAEAIAAPHATDWWVALELAEVRAALGQALRAAGRRAEAITTLEQALAVMLEHIDERAWVAPRVALARVQSELGQLLLVEPTTHDRGVSLMAAAIAFHDTPAGHPAQATALRTVLGAGG